jgi:hypothetical protein
VSLEAELEPKLSEIFRLAHERFGDYLEGRGYMLDQDGVVIRYTGPELPGLQHPPIGSQQQAQEEWQDYSDTLMELVERFRTFYAMQPAQTSGVRAVLGEFPGRAGTIVGKLKAAAQCMESVRGLLGIMPAPPDSGTPSWQPTSLDSTNWDGSSARAFFDTLLFPFQYAAYPMQVACVLELATAVEACKRGCEYAEAGLKHIAGSCIAALEGPDALDEALAAFDTVAFVFSAAEFVGMNTGIVGKIVDKAAFVKAIFDSHLLKASENESHTSPDLDVTKGTPIQTLQSCLAAIDRLERKLHDTEVTVSEGLKGDLGDPASFSSQDLWLHQTGALEDQDFHLRDEARGVVAPIEDLYRAGRRYLPDTASWYDVAHSDLDQCDLPGGLKKWFPNSIYKYDEARRLLAHILTVTRDNLRDAGTTLAEIARDYEVTDEDNAREIAKWMSEFDASM